MSITMEAQKIVSGDRARDYGDMNESFNRIAGLWSAYLGVSVDKFDVAKMMILLKVSRAKHGNHRDSYVDIVGYIECIDTMLEDDDDTPDESCSECIADAVRVFQSGYASQEVINRLAREFHAKYPHVDEIPKAE